MSVEYTDAEYERAEQIIQEHQRRKNADYLDAARRRYTGKFFKTPVSRFHTDIVAWCFIFIAVVRDRLLRDKP